MDFARKRYGKVERRQLEQWPQPQKGMAINHQAKQLKPAKAGCLKEIQLQAQPPEH